MRRRGEAHQLAAHLGGPHDAGAILFGNAATITDDGPWQHFLVQLTGRKWRNLDVEIETGCGIVPYTYRGSKLVNAVQWAVGLELLLLINEKGGTIEVAGNASDWVGAEMSDGLIRIRGNPGDQAGAACRGSAFGMRDGTILIDGSAGMEVGMRMKRGIIAVRGPVRNFAGCT